MEDFYIGVLVGAFLTIALIKLMAAIIRHTIEDDIDRKVKEGLDKLKERIIPSRIERVNNMLYIYNKETEEFLGQAHTMKELSDVLEKRFPGKLFNVSQDEIDKHLKEES